MSAAARPLGKSLVEAALTGIVCAAALGLWVAFRALPFHQTLSDGDRRLFLLALVSVYALLGALAGAVLGALLHAITRGRQSAWWGASAVFLALSLAWFFAPRWGFPGGSMAGAIFGIALAALLLFSLRTILRGRARWVWCAVLVAEAVLCWRMPHMDGKVAGDPAVLERLRAQATSQPAPLLVLALDGVEREILEEGIARGELPNLARVWESGVRAPLRTLEPTWSPPLWTSFWTGRLPKDHGIHYFLAQGSYELPGVGPVVVPRLLGARRLAELLLTRLEVPVNQALRSATSVWEVLGLAGRESVVANELVSWPVLPVRGVALSNRLLFDLEDASGLAYPDSLGALAMQRISLAASWPDSGLVHAPWLAHALGRERALWQFALEQAQAREAKLTILYTHLIDSAQHRYLKYHWPLRYRFAVDPERTGQLGEVVRASYRGVDAMVGEALAALPTARVLLISDHGVRPNPHLREDVDEPLDTLVMPATHEEFVSGVHGDAPDGVFALCGPDLAAAASPLQPVELLEVGPLILRLLGLPAAADWERSAPARVLEFATQLGPDPGSVPSYEGLIPRDLGLVGSATDEAVLEQLRALGYIE